VLFVEGLKHSLLSISQLCDKGYQITFKSNTCEISLPKSQEVLLIGTRINNVYLFDISYSASISCLLTKHEESWLSHRRITHIHIYHLNKLISRDLVVGLPKLKFDEKVDSGIFLGYSLSTHAYRLHNKRLMTLIKLTLQNKTL